MPVTEVRGFQFYHSAEDQVHSDPKSIEKTHFREIDRLCESDLFKTEVDRDFLVDIGACHGESSMLFLRDYGFEKAICVEPVRENFFHLCENIRRNGINGQEIRCYIINAACWHEPTRIVPQIDNPGGSTLFELCEDASGGVETCPYQTIEKIVSNSFDELPTFVWMDCQGAEDLILFHQGEKAVELCKRFYIEVHNRTINHERFMETVTRLFDWFGVYGSAKRFIENPEKEPISTLAEIYDYRAKYQWVLFGKDD
jgi:FkbM family methyltransferase